MRNINWGIVSAVVIAGAVGIMASETFVGWFAKKEAPIKSPTPTNIQSIPLTWGDVQVGISQDIKDAYMDGCMDGDLFAYGYCQCTIDYFDARLTDDEFLEVGKQLESGSWPTIAVEAVSECVWLY